VNFYSFHIGDYASATRHLSWEEDLAYRRLIDTYYMREGPLPADRKQVYRLVVASSKAQRAAVDSVLEEFFTLSADGYVNSRCDAELQCYRKKSDKARQSAEARWSKPSAMPTDQDRNANASADGMRTHCEGNAPITNTSKERRGEVVARARDPDADLEHKLRKAAGWENHPNPKLAITGEIQALIDNGADLELDVLPTIKAIASQADSPSWRYFVKAIARQRDQRVEAATIVSPPSNSNGGIHAAPRQKPSRSAIFDAIHASIDRAERRPVADGGGDARNPAEDAA
jgi:uncharacterized protein YdaU (DUF1376 family)